MTAVIEIESTFVGNYFANRLYSSVWDNASESEQTKAIEWSKKIVAGAFDFCEEAYEIDAEDETTVVWNDRVLAAVCEEAIWLLKRDPTDYPELLTLGMAEGTAGASFKADRSMVAPLVCRAAIRLIGNLASYVDPESGSGSISSSMLS